MALPSPSAFYSAKSLSFKESRKFCMDSGSDFISVLPFQLPKEVSSSPKHLEALLQLREKVYEELESFDDYIAFQNGSSMFPHIDHATLVRFLKARKYDVEKAFLMLADYIAFRVIEYPENSVQTSEIKASLDAGKVQVLKYPDRLGHLCVAITLSKHNVKDVSAGETERFIVYCFDQIISKILKGKKSMSKLTIFVNLQGVGWNNLDVEGAKKLFTILQNYFPERLALLFNWCPPSIFWIAYKMILPFIDPNTRRKIAMANHQKDLRKYFDPSKLPCSLGGTGSEDLLISIENLTEDAVLLKDSTHNL